MEATSAVQAPHSSMPPLELETTTSIPSRWRICIQILFRYYPTTGYTDHPEAKLPQANQEVHLHARSCWIARDQRWLLARRWEEKISSKVRNRDASLTKGSVGIDNNGIKHNDAESICFPNTR
ncbi:unnamed protein product [Linum trigynum]|uniref:Uncharacterized protein n=1 Tax=Linum trigynum TaxID=586398 RepID=A0AAV2F7F5_9ROSI